MGGQPGPEPGRWWAWDLAEFQFPAENNAGAMERVRQGSEVVTSVGMVGRPSLRDQRGSPSRRVWKGLKRWVGRALTGPHPLLQVRTLPATAAYLERPGRQVQQHGGCQGLCGQSGLHSRLRRVLCAGGSRIPHVSGKGPCLLPRPELPAAVCQLCSARGGSRRACGNLFGSSEV